MNEKLLREMKNNSPNFIRKHPKNNIIYMNYITNRNMIPINNIGFYEDTIGQKNNKENYINFRPTMRNKNDIKTKLSLISEDLSSKNNSIITNLRNENKSLQIYIKNCENEILLRDNEIENYKIKVQALLGQVKDKNDDLNKKRNIINALAEEKVKNTTNLQTTYKDNEKYQKENEYLKQVIQNMNQSKKLNLKLMGKMDGFRPYQYDLDNMENKKYISDYENNEENNQSNRSDGRGFDKLIINSFGLIFKGDMKNKNYMNNNIKENLNKSKELIDKLRAELNKYKKELEESKKMINYKDVILQNKEKMIADLSNEIKMRKNENAILLKNINNNNTKNDNKTINFDIINNEKKDLEATLKDLKIQMDLKIRENNELKIKLKSIIDEKKNKENIIDEQNEEIENQKETYENIKKEFDEKKKEFDEMKKDSETLRQSYKNLENKNKEILNENKELKKDNEKMYSDNSKLKSNINKLNEELENNNIIKEELENEKNKMKERNDNLLNDKEELSQKLISMQDNYNNAQKEIEKIKNINNDLKEQIKNYQNNGNFEPGNASGANQFKKNNNEDNIEDNKIIGDDDDNNKSTYEQAKKENETLQKRVIQLNDLIQDMNNQINSLNIKYQEQKRENKNLKEVSQALIEKQKNVQEQKDKIEHISPETHYIITKKSYNKLAWYLVSTINPENKNDIQINDYDNYKWVTDLIIPQSLLNRYNKFEDDDTKINDLYTYIQKMQSKLEQKEEEISKKDYVNKKLNNQLQNKTANIKQEPFLLNKVFNNEQNNLKMNKSNSNQNFTNNRNNANSDVISPGQDVEKYKNLLEQLNDYGEREIKFRNEITKLRSQLKDKEEFQSGMNNINDISHHFDSNFIEDEKDDKKVIDLLSDARQHKTKRENKGANKKDDENFLGILNDVPGNESDLDEVKGLKNFIKFLKNDIKEKEKVLNALIEQIKEIIKELKWNNKNNQRVTKILTILGYTPEIIKIVIDNKKGYNFDFNLNLKK